MNFCGNNLNCCRNNLNFHKNMQESKKAGANLQLHTKTCALAKLSLVFYQDLTPLCTTTRVEAYNSMVLKGEGDKE